MELRETIEGMIDKPLGRMRDEEAVEWVLRRRLTKKEFKVLMGPLRGVSDAQLQEKLKLDTQRLKEIRSSIRRKLNRDSIKRELYETGKTS
ncbi:hypothetical protein [Nitratifractor sp.]|uniref:hypothetical protein n=1 Tax=Nitratifractor sp. TaxID=2268144 RepID=UPI0025E376A0|nr:hypothetical protein [Nitratifractor sp.]